MRRVPIKETLDPSEQRLQIVRMKIRSAEGDYLDAIRILTSAAHKRKPKLDPQLVATLGRNLKMIDQTIAATRRAYATNPEDPDLAQYMLTAYARKVQVLEELASSNALLREEATGGQN